MLPIVCIRLFGLFSRPFAVFLSPGAKGLFRVSGVELRGNIPHHDNTFPNITVNDARQVDMLYNLKL